MTRCTRVSPVVRGFVMVKFDDEPQPHKLPLRSYEHCSSTETTERTDGRFTFHWCAKHDQATP